MPRGRRSQPDEVKALKGNPGKRRLALTKKPAAKPARTRAPVTPIPAFLTDKREREIFRRIVDDYLQRRIARTPDLTAYARWAHYVHRWIDCKEKLDARGGDTFFESESKHGKLLRRHPLFKDQLDVERVLQSLEDRLGLNPIARQNLIRGLAALPPALGELFGDDEKPRSEAPEPDAPAKSPEVPAPESPLGYLQ